LEHVNTLEIAREGKYDVSRAVDGARPSPTPGTLTTILSRPPAAVAVPVGPAA
jgi:hypothetical protein